MPNYIPRVAEKTVRKYLSSFSVVGITGPRQSGKSTLLKHLLPHYRYVTFDDFRNVDFFNDDPIAFMQQYADQVIFDEVQFAPKIFHHIKLAVDNDRDNYGKFVLTGSSQFSYLKSAAESLAGRMGLFDLLPLQYQEIPQTLKEYAIIKGSYPELVKRNYSNVDLWYASYIETYLQKDVAALANISDLADFRRLLNLLAANTASILDYSTYAKHIGVSVPTVKRWIRLLEASYIIFLLPPYSANLGKRYIKSPKIYFYDTGLVATLTGIESFDIYEKGPMAGALFENYMIAEIFKMKKNIASNDDLYFLRTSDKKEIDLLVDKKQKKHWIEIKKTKSFKPIMLKEIEFFLQSDDEGFLLYNGEDFPYKKNLHVQHYTDYLLSES